MLSKTKTATVGLAIIVVFWMMMLLFVVEDKKEVFVSNSDARQNWGEVLPGMGRLPP